jgi:hypothetical protein
LPVRQRHNVGNFGNFRRRWSGAGKETQILNETTFSYAPETTNYNGKYTGINIGNGKRSHGGGVCGGSPQTNKRSMEHPRIMLYVFAICTTIVIIFAAKQPKRVNPIAECTRTGGTWVSHTVMDVVVVWDGYSYVPMPHYRSVGSCEHTDTK